MERSGEVWLTSQELADRLKIKVCTLDKWACNGIGPHFIKAGRVRRYPVGDVLVIDPVEEAWLTSEELANRLKIKVVTLNKWACAGFGPRFIKSNRIRRYPLSDIAEWEQALLAEALLRRQSPWDDLLPQQLSDLQSVADRLAEALMNIANPSLRGSVAS